MQLITKAVPENYNLFLFGDLHIGNSLFYRAGLKKLIGMMLKPYAGIKANFAVVHGDVLEAITLDDKRWAKAPNQIDIIEEQYEEAERLLGPIADKIVTILDGNHERKLWRVSAYARRLCKRFGVPYGTYTARISYVDKAGLQFRHYATHGRKSITSTADDPKRRRVNMQLILKRHLKFKSSTCMLASKGHTHKLLVCRPDRELYLNDDGRRITQHYTTAMDIDPSGYVHHDLRWYCNTGSLMRLYQLGHSGYAEECEYDPIELGLCVARVRNRRIVDIDEVVL